MNASNRFASLIQTFFTEYLVGQRDVSPRTISAYRDTFRLLFQFLSSTFGKTPDKLTLDVLNGTNVAAFLQHLEEKRGNSVRTRNCRLAALRSFLRYVVAMREPDLLAQTQQVLAIPLKRHTRPLLGFLTLAEINGILRSTSESRAGRRDHALFQFLYNTGARVSEAINARVKDVQTREFHSVELLGKGRKQRVVPLWKETSQALRAWVRFAGLSQNDILFPNRFGTAMTRNAVQQRLRLCVQSASEACPSLRSRKISPHTLRHTTAMHLLQSGVSSPVIALWLGHENPATTHQYVEADLLMKEKALSRMQPPRQKNPRFKPSCSLLRFLDSL
ncbi:MAG: tyrosine-type recombinase/integrase [Roseovarius sp.]